MYVCMYVCIYAFRMIPWVNSDYLREENRGGLGNRHAVFCEAGTGFVYIRRTSSVSSNQSPLSFISLLCVRDCNLVS